MEWRDWLLPNRARGQESRREPHGVTAAKDAKMIAEQCGVVCVGARLPLAVCVREAMIAAAAGRDL